VEKPKKAPVVVDDENDKIENESSEFSFEEDSSAADTSAESSTSDLSTSASDQFASGALEISLDPKTKERLVGEVEAKKKKVTEIKHSDPRGVVYLGHIPYGFFENQMKEFFGQFGVVTRVKLSRNKKTGNSRHYAFIEFLDQIVAKIVADTMNGYVMFPRVLVCEVVPPEKVHPNMFMGHNKTITPYRTTKINMEKVNKERTKEELEKRETKLLNREENKRKKLQNLGIDYDFPGFRDDKSKQIQPDLAKEAQT